MPFLLQTEYERLQTPNDVSHNELHLLHLEIQTKMDEIHHMMFAAEYLA